MDIHSLTATRGAAGLSPAPFVKSEKSAQRSFSAPHLKGRRYSVCERKGRFGALFDFHRHPRVNGARAAQAILLGCMLLILPSLARAATTLTDSPEFTANEIYEIMSADPVEGAAIGASFSGLGIDNEPHQQLANRTAFLNNHRLTDETNIGVLQAFVAQFTGLMGQSGYMKIPVTDVNKGQIQYVVQWGFYSLEGQTASAIQNTPWTVSFPIAFPHFCEWGLSNYAANDFVNPGAFKSGMMNVEVGNLTTGAMTVFTDWDNSATIQVAGAGGSPVGLTGFYWIAIGY